GANATGKGPDGVPEDTRWHMFVTYTFDALSEDPTFVTVQVTPDDDPVQIGPISTNSDCEAPEGSRNLLDFIDMVMDKEGRVYVAYADGCLEGCKTMEDSRGDRGYVAVLQTGPSLLAAVGTLASPEAKAAETGSPGAPVLPVTAPIK
ncbi:MAG TPA: hypothetical protein VNZ52_14125, partial [Candidatus Thermoplasmatota archaeon]|nr:hypothetical protein [Candidatus Thermoplasmatota archaeon]